MCQPKSLAAMVESLMEAHQLTVSSLGKLLGKTTELKKLLSGKLDPIKCDHLVGRLTMLKLFTDDENEKLACSAKLNRLGMHTFLSRYAFGHLLSSQFSGTPMRLCMVDGRPFREYIEEWKNADQVEILFQNCCIPSLMQELKDLLCPEPCNVSIWQYAVPDQQMRSDAIVLYASIPVLFHPRYQLKLLHHADQEKIHYFLNDDVMLVRTVSAESRKEQLFLFREQQEIYELPPTDGSGMLPALQSFLDGMFSSPAASGFVIENQTDHSIALLSFLGWEMNRCFWSIGCGLPFFAYPGHIIRDMLKDSGTFLKEGSQTKKLLDLHVNRLKNVVQGKKTRCFTASVRALEGFMRTGIPAGHISSARAFSPEERIQILRFFLSVLAKNTSIHFHLYNDPDFQPECYFLGYENDAVLISRHPMDLCTPGESYAMITSPPYLSAYQDYYLNQLLGEQCMSREESMHYLEKLYSAYGMKEITVKGDPDDQSDSIAYC